MAHATLTRAEIPLPEESAFVVAARESIPEARSRLTTANNRGNLRGRGRGRSNSTSRARAAKSGTSRENASGSGTTRENAGGSGTTRENGRGRTRTQKRTAEGSTSGTAAPPVVTRRRTYNTGPGSAHYLLFGDDGQQMAQTVPDLNAMPPDWNGEEIPISQSAPNI